MNIHEEAILDSAKQIAVLEEAIKNLKTQQKEFLEQFRDNASDKTARNICDIMIEIEKKKEEIKQLKKDIKVNIEELAKTK